MRSQLQCPRWRGAGLQRADLAKVGIAERCVRIAQVGVVEGIERLHAELNAMLVVERDPLQQGEVCGNQARAATKGAWRVAEGVRSILREGTRVEPLGDLLRPRP